MEKKCKVVLLPTDKDSNLFFHCPIGSEKSLHYMSQGKVHREEMLKAGINKPQHLYILSDDEIKQDELCLTNEGSIVRFSNFSKVGKFNKIIATTDFNLIKEGIASIDDEFIKDYCNNAVEEVNVEYEETVGAKYIPSYNFDLPEANEIIFQPKLSSNGSILIKSVEDEKNNINWFNEYQKVEDYIIKLLGDNYSKIELIKGSDSDKTIQLINEVIKPVEETWGDIYTKFNKSNNYPDLNTIFEYLSENYEPPKKKQ